MKNQYRKWIMDRLKEIRRVKRLKQKQVAEKLGIKLSTYQSYEEGRAEPSIFTLKMFCKLCKIKIDKFLQDSPENEEVKA